MESPQFSAQPTGPTDSGIIKLIFQYLKSSMNAAAIFLAEKLFVMQDRSPFALYLFLKSLNADGQFNRAQFFILKNKKIILARAPHSQNPTKLIDQSDSLLFAETSALLLRAQTGPLLYPDLILVAVEAFAATNLWEECLEILGEPDAENFDSSTPLLPPEHQSPIKYESLLALWRGRVLLNIENRGFNKKAKQWLLKAIEIDPLNFDAFDCLLENELLYSEEGIKFLNQLKFGSYEWLKELYTSKLKKYNYEQNGQISQALTTLKDKWQLGKSTDILASEAELAFYQNDFPLAYQLCQDGLQRDPAHPLLIRIYLPTLVELKKKNELFYFSHKLSEASPQAALTLYAIGCYYFGIEAFSQARQFFGKATNTNPRFGPAWVAFGHSFALQGEHDQALAAYRTAIRYLPGCHFIPLSIGMESMAMNNFTLANQYCLQAQQLCPSDPLIYNELGVVAFKNKDYNAAADFFYKAIDLLGDDANPSWEATFFNLGHCLRKLGNFKEAIQFYNQARDMAPNSGATWAALGFTHALQGDYDMSIQMFHRALSLKPEDSFATEMLNRVLNLRLDFF